jgi:hypothetical protein
MPQLMTEVLARSLYRQVQPGVDGVYPPALTYERDYFFDAVLGSNPFGTRKDWLTGYGLDNNATVLVVGSGFGYLMEELINATITDVWGIEGGDWFWDIANDTEWATGMKARTANDWIGSGTEQASLDALPGVPNNEKFGWILDEDAVTMHSDAELPAFIAACEDRLQGNAKGRIVHLVTPTPVQGPGDSSVNWKTMAEWKAVAPDHNWVNIGTGVVE